MLVIPDPSTALMDPFMAHPTMTMICNIVDPVTKEPYSRDPRYIAQKAEAYLKSTGIGDTIFFGPEAEFFIFDDIQYDNQVYGSFYSVDSSEGIWNTGRDEGPNLGYKPRHKEGYFRFRPPTPSRTSAPRWSWCLAERFRHLRWRRSITKWPPPGRPKSTCGSPPWS